MTTSENTPAQISPQRQKGLDMMSKVYGWEMKDGPGDFFAHTADQVFGEVWTREQLSIRDRRLLLLGALSATGQLDVAELQAGAAIGNGELDGDDLREIALFLCYYIGWPLGSALDMKFGGVIDRHEKAQRGNN